jgi:elongation factor Ts
MAEISAKAVMALRAKTQLPMMECKKALIEADGDQEAAFTLLRKQGKKTMEARSDRETAFGRIAIRAEAETGRGAMIELCCESDPVAKGSDFRELYEAILNQLFEGPGAETPAELLAQPSPANPDQTLEEAKQDLFNRIREIMNLTRIQRIDGACGGYVHHNGMLGALVHVEGGNQQLANEVAMHITAMNPDVVSTDQLDQAAVANEREILIEAARKEGKPENIIEKMVEGRLRNYYAERVLLEQAFVKDEKMTVGKICKEAGMKVLGFTKWELGKA